MSKEPVKCAGSKRETLVSAAFKTAESLEVSMSGHPELGDREKIEEQRRLARYPSDCPVCHVKRGEHCVTSTGKLSHNHKSRPTH